MSHPKILVLLVNYFNETETVSFIEDQLMKQSYDNLEIVICINECKEPGILQALASQLQNIHIFDAGSNIGYFPGAALGLREYLKINPEMPEFVIISNADIEIPENDFLRKLSKNAAGTEYSVMGPAIRSGLMKQQQNPYIPVRIGIAKMKMLRFLTSNYWLYNTFLLYYYFKTRVGAFIKSRQLIYKTPAYVYGIHGSFMVFRKSFFEMGGDFDYPFPLFGEEIYIAEMARNKGMKVWFNPSITVIHKEHHTTGIFKSKKNVENLNRSFDYFIHKFE